MGRVFYFERQQDNFLVQCRKSGTDSGLAARQTDLTGIMEGIYIKVEDGDYVTDRLKVCAWIFPQHHSRFREPLGRPADYRQLSGRRSGFVCCAGGSGGGCVRKFLEKFAVVDFSFQKLSCKYDELKQMRDIPQNPAYHGEGDVYHHTEMVCESLLALPEWGNLRRRNRSCCLWRQLS